MVIEGVDVEIQVGFRVPVDDEAWPKLILLYTIEDVVVVTQSIGVCSGGGS